MPKPTLLYDLSVLVSDDLRSVAGEIAETLGRGEHDVTAAINASADRYATGEVSQGRHWDAVAEHLGLLDTDVLTTYAMNAATVDQAILGRIRAQAPTHTLGLLSDATPDWVGHFRKSLKLDQLLAVHIIDSDLDERHTYEQLLRLSAERLQAPLEQIWFIERKPVHLDAARKAGMQAIPLSDNIDYRQAFSVIPAAK